MEYNTRGVLTGLFLAIIIAIVVIYIQIKLSKMKNSIMGLILPIANFIYNLNTVFFAIGYGYSQLLYFIKCNWTTYILIIIYIICRKKINKNNINIINSVLKI